MSDEPANPSTSLVPASNNDGRAPAFPEPSDAFRAEGRKLFREHRKAQLLSSAIATFAAFVAVRVLFYIRGTQPMPWTEIGVTLAAAVLAVLITLLILYTYYRLGGAPVAVYARLTEELAVMSKLLAAEQGKNSDAQISGEILYWSASGKTEKDKPFTVVGMYLNAKVSLVNNSPAKTSIKQFYMVISVGGKELVSEYAADGATIDEEPGFESKVTDDGKLEYQYVNLGETVENLFKSPVIAEHTVTHAGWLQFYFPRIELRNMYNGKAYVVMVDHKNRHHTTEPFFISPS